MKEENKKQIAVSNLFKEIYINFNVCSQIENMKKLSKKELYLLLTHALDLHSKDDATVLKNFQHFKDEMMEIYDIQDDKETENTILLELIEETGFKYIDTDKIVDSEGQKLREPYTKQEARLAKINLIDK